MYTMYMWIVLVYGVRVKGKKGRGAPAKEKMRWAKRLAEARVVNGRQAAWAVVIMFAASVMTLSKTVLYCEYYRVLSKASLPFGIDRDRGLLAEPSRSSISLSCSWTDHSPVFHESFSGFEGVGHNDLGSLFFIWIIPK